MMWPFSGGGESSDEYAENEGRISFVYSDSENKLYMEDECVKMLQSLKEPVAIVAVCGRVRTGKSFILNQLLESNTFAVSSERNPCTYGLSLSTPIRRTAPDGSVCNIFLLDTEAIDACPLEETHSMQVVSLAILLSSLLIYNQIGSLDEVERYRLSLMIEMTEHIRHSVSQGRDMDSMLKECSPIFLLLLRDSPSCLVEGNHQFTPQEYLEHILRIVELRGNHVAAMNKVVESIQAFFPERECCTLVRPVTDEHDLQQLDQITSDTIRPEFRDGLTTLKTFIMERARPKQVGCAVMTGPTLVRITQMFLDVLNGGVVSSIFSAWKNNEEVRCLTAYLSGEQFFTCACNRVSPDEVVSENMFDGKFKAAMCIFDTVAAPVVGMVREKYRKLLRRALEKNIKERCHAAQRIAQAKAMERAKIMSGILQITPRKREACLAVEDGMYFDRAHDLGSGRDVNVTAGDSGTKMKLL